MGLLVLTHWFVAIQELYSFIKRLNSLTNQSFLAYEPFCVAISGLFVIFDDSGLAQEAVAKELQILGTRSMKSGYNSVVLFVFATLLIHSIMGFLAGSTNLVQEDVVKIALLLCFLVSDSLINVHIARSISWPRPVLKKVFVDKAIGLLHLGLSHDVVEAFNLLRGGASYRPLYNVLVFEADGARQIQVFLPSELLLGPVVQCKLAIKVHSIGINRSGTEVSC